MIKQLLLSLLILLSTLKAEDAFIFDKASFFFEDDIYSQTDEGYSAGSKLSFLYFVPKNYALYDYVFSDEEPYYSYITFAFVNQIYTPTDTQSTQLQVDDRPYAGWTYGEVAIYRSYKDSLKSLALQVGMIGPASHAEDLQNGIHSLIGSKKVNGWDNQLHNELGINLKYTHKFLYEFDKIAGVEGMFLPFYSGELGNISIKATAGASYRFGWNIQKDYGVTSIDIGGDQGIPIYGEFDDMRNKDWSFSFNLLAAGSVVLRDIFLDGNTFGSSHSVDKEALVGYGGIGFTARYKRFMFEFIEIHNTKKFKKENGGHGVGTMVFSWLF